MSLNSAIATGSTYHVRRHPTHHQFYYKMSYLWLDLDEVDEIQSMLSDIFWMWPRLKTSDYLGKTSASLHQKARTKLTEFVPDYQPQKIVLMAQIRWCGIYFSPVNFVLYGDDEKYDYLIAEVTNTPWLEKHYYCLNLHHLEPVQKVFHVSPFNPIQMQYRWHIELDKAVKIRIDCYRQQCEFSAGINLNRQPLNHNSLKNMVRRYPAQTIKIMAGIYYQAFRLWLKRTPIYPHP